MNRSQWLEAYRERRRDLRILGLDERDIEQNIRSRLEKIYARDVMPELSRLIVELKRKYKEQEQERNMSCSGCITEEYFSKWKALTGISDFLSDHSNAPVELFEVHGRDPMEMMLSMKKWFKRSDNDHADIAVKCVELANKLVSSVESSTRFVVTLDNHNGFFARYIFVVPFEARHGSMVDSGKGSAVCECGSDKIGGGAHSSWCPKHGGAK